MGQSRNELFEQAARELKQGFDGDIRIGDNDVSAIENDDDDMIVAIDRSGFRRCNLNRLYKS